MAHETWLPATHIEDQPAVALPMVGSRSVRAMASKAGWEAAASAVPLVLSKLHGDDEEILATAIRGWLVEGDNEATTSNVIGAVAGLQTISMMLLMTLAKVTSQTPEAILERLALQFQQHGDD